MLKGAIIDDEYSVYGLLSKIIEIEQLPILITHYAKDGQEAMSLLENESFDLIFIDIVMPYNTGLEIMAAYPQNNYIVVTAYDDFTNAQQALRIGARDILLKPIRRDALKTSIKRVMRLETSGHDLVDCIMEDIRKHYSDNTEVQALAEKYFIQASNLCRLFKQYTDMTIISYRNNLRLEAAKDLLVKSTMSINEISHRVGYHNPSYFYRLFKQQYHMTPKRYREKIRLKY